MPTRIFEPEARPLVRRLQKAADQTFRDSASDGRRTVLTEDCVLAFRELIETGASTLEAKGDPEEEVRRAEIKIGIFAGEMALEARDQRCGLTIEIFTRVRTALCPIYPFC